jgi:hypothetical protein
VYPSHDTSLAMDYQVSIVKKKTGWIGYGAYHTYNTQYHTNDNTITTFSISVISIIVQTAVHVLLVNLLTLSKIVPTRK